MMSFFTGAVLAAGLALATYLGLQGLTITQIERYDDRSTVPPAPREATE